MPVAKTEKNIGLKKPVWGFWVTNITYKKLGEIYRNIESN